MRYAPEHASSIVGTRAVAQGNASVCNFGRNFCMRSRSGKSDTDRASSGMMRTSGPRGGQSRSGIYPKPFYDLEKYYYELKHSQVHNAHGKETFPAVDYRYPDIWSWPVLRAQNPLIVLH